MVEKTVNSVRTIQFQDINAIYSVSDKQAVFLVGDPNQAIYGFQGATPELISFSKDKN